MLYEIKMPRSAIFVTENEGVFTFVTEDHAGGWTAQYEPDYNGIEDVIETVVAPDIETALELHLGQNKRFIRSIQIVG